jgi:tetratricopeptide (TPR) repeat protein
MEAACHYEAGALRKAERAVGRGLEVMPADPALLTLQGLVWADLGRGTEALGVLERAAAGARTSGDEALVARAALHRGLVFTDLGDHARARMAFEQAQQVAQRASLAEVAQEAHEQLAALATGGGEDVVGRVARRLRRGDTAGANRLAAEAAATNPRERARADIVAAMVARTEGRIEAAVPSLLSARDVARDVGLVREEATARLELGHVYGLAGRDEDARRELEAALKLVAGTSFAIRELDVRVALAQRALATSDVSAASAQLAAMSELGVRPRPVRVQARVDELAGRVAHAKGDASSGGAALMRARGAWEALGAWVEAARVASTEVRLEAIAGLDTQVSTAAATALFAKAGDPRGPIHVAIAEGLGRVRSGDLERALEVFAEAARRARQLEDPVSVRLGEVAESNAAQVLGMLGHAPDPEALSGLGDVEGRHKAFTEARAAYERGRADFGEGRYERARLEFEAALAGFDTLGERRHAKAARSGRAWAMWNVAAATAPKDAISLFDEVALEARGLDEDELGARAVAGAAIAAARLGGSDVEDRLRNAVVLTEERGLTDLTVRCWVALAESSVALATRVEAARIAHGMRQDEVTVYAMYSVAVDAYRADELALAIELAEGVLPHAGSLQSSVSEVRDAAQEALDDGM